MLVQIINYLRPRLGFFHQYMPRLFNIPARYFDVQAPVQPAPKISIVTPTHNEAHLLERTIFSIYSQQYANLEYIIQDRGSTDGTLELIEKSRVHLKYFESPAADIGRVYAINAGFQHASGEIMAYLNPDNRLLPGTLNYVANYFSTHPQVDVIYGHRLLINESDEVIGDWIMPPHHGKTLRWANFIPQETLFWRRRIWDKVGGQLDESFSFAMDWDLLLRFQEAGAVFKRLPRVLAAFRVYPWQKTSERIIDWDETEAARLRLRNFGRDVNKDEVTRNILPFLRLSVAYHLMHRMKIWAHRFLANQDKEQQIRRGKEQPRESIYFYSLHKAGTALFTRVLRQVNELEHIDYETLQFNNKLNGPLSFEKYGKLYGVLRINEYGTASSDNLVKQVSAVEFVKGKTIVFLIRDPRDILISFYYSMGYTHVQSADPVLKDQAQKLRNEIQQLSLDEFALKSAPDVLKRFEILYDLSTACKDRVILKYEDLLDHFDDFMSGFSRYISIPAVVQQELFYASRPKNAENLSAHKRSGRMGQYKEKLKPETLIAINQILKPILEKFDYPIDDSSTA